MPIVQEHRIGRPTGRWLHQSWLLGSDKCGLTQLRWAALLVLVLGLLLSAEAISAHRPNELRAESSAEEIRVDGEYPGPAMWRVARPQDPEAHVMWVVADIALLPRKMKWKSVDIENAVRNADEVLLFPTIDVKPEGEIGFRNGLSLLRLALGIRKNPNDRRLKDVVAPEIYLRWMAQKKIYLPRNTAIERWRPVFAVDKLFDKALDRLGLREQGVIWESIEKRIEKHGIKTTRPTLSVVLPLEELKTSLQAFSHEDLQDQECFDTSLQLIAAISDSASMRARANAWATADLAALSWLDKLPDPHIACMRALLESTIAKQIFPENIGARFAELWLSQAEASLATNRSTVAILPLSLVIQPDGWIAKLQSMGYEVTAPSAN